LESLDSGFVAGSMRAFASMRFVMTELVSMRDADDAGVAEDDRALVLNSADGRTALGCTKVTVSKPSSAAGVP
jgi:hypothetical protein